MQSRLSTKKKQYYRDTNLLIFTVIFLSIFITGYGFVFQNGKVLIWNVDGIGQYYPAFLYIGQYLRRQAIKIISGNFNIDFFDLSIGFGEDIIGTWNYYGFGDPFNIISILANDSNGALIYSISFFLRVYLAGIALYLYCKTMNFSALGSIAASLSYTFCGFVLIGCVSYIQWLSVVIYLPLLLLGSEKILRERKGWVLSLASAYGALSGFYYLYMASLCLAIYVIVRVNANKELYPKLSNKVLICFYCILWYLIGLFIAAPILFPALQSYFNSARSTNNFLSIISNWKNYFPSLNISFWASFLNDYSAINDNATGITFCEETAAVILLFLPASKKKKQFVITEVLSLIALSLPITGWLFNGFGETNDRWIIIIHLWLSVNLAFVLTEIERTRNIIKSKTRTNYLRKISVITVLSFGILINMHQIYSQSKNNWQDEMMPTDDLNERYIASPFAYSNCIKQIEKGDVFRIENSSITNINGRPENIAMLNGYYGSTYWYSIGNYRVQAFVNLLTDGNTAWRSYGLYGNSAAATLCGVKYYMTENESNAPSNYKLVEKVEKDEKIWGIYENPDYFGMSYIRNKNESDELWKKIVGTNPDKDQDYVRNAASDGSEIGENFRRYLEKLINNNRSNDYGSISSFSYKENNITLAVNVKDGNEAIISVPYSTNWRAKVDGNSWSLKPADVMFISVEGLTPGEHTIELHYVPIAFYIGLAFCGAGLLTIAFLCRNNRLVRLLRCKAMKRK